MIQNNHFEKTYQLVKPYSNKSKSYLFQIYNLVLNICQQKIGGNFLIYDMEDSGLNLLLAKVIQEKSLETRLIYYISNVNNTFYKNHNVDNIVKSISINQFNSFNDFKNWLGIISLLYINTNNKNSTFEIFNNLYDRINFKGNVLIYSYHDNEVFFRLLNKFQSLKNINFEIKNIDNTSYLFSKDENYIFNNELSSELIRNFIKDDISKFNVISQMSVNERFQIYYLISKYFNNIKKIRFLEIGSYTGASLLLITNCLKNLKIDFQGYSIEPFKNTYLDNILNSLNEKVVHINDFSFMSLNKLKDHLKGDLLNLILIDGDHNYETIIKDINMYFPLLNKNGFIIFHDYLPEINSTNKKTIYYHHGDKESGVRRACNELIENTNKLIDLPLLFKNNFSQTQNFLPIIPNVFSTIRVYRKS